MPRAEDSLIGRTIAGKFAIEAHIGSGAMGQVYKARQVALEKTVAVKVLHQDLARDEVFAARFHREAKAASRLDHPNSMRVIDFGAEPDGMLYIAMEYLDGRDLLRVITEDSPLAESRIVDILSQALAALVVAHDMGVIHRDLKPENIMVLDGVDDEGHRIDTVKVCDFGIAKINGRTLAGAAETHRGPITMEGLVVGTPEYMSPEQGKGDALDARSDLYSVGIILFQLLAGRIPFQGESALGIVFKQVNEPPPRPSAYRQGIDPRLEAACLKALAKRPDDRFQTAREMRSALRAVWAGERGRRSSVPASNPSSSDPLFEHAETQRSLNPIRGEGAISSGVTPLGTPGGTTALPPLPVSTPNVWVMGLVAVVLGAGMTLFGVMRWSQPGNAAAPAVSASAASPAASQAEREPPAISAPTQAATGEASALPPTPKATVAHAPATRATPPPQAAVVAAPANPTTHATPAAPPASAPGAFSLVTSAASPTVVKAVGVSAHDVRAALPSWKFTQCYRDALQKTNTALGGHLTLALTIDPSGSVSRVAVRGAGALVSATGDCMMDAAGHATISGTLAPGATADVDVACTPL